MHAFSEQGVREGYFWGRVITRWILPMNAARPARKFRSPMYYISRFSFTPDADVVNGPNTARFAQGVCAHCDGPTLNPSLALVLNNKRPSEARPHSLPR